MKRRWIYGVAFFVLFVGATGAISTIDNLIKPDQVLPPPLVGSYGEWGTKTAAAGDVNNDGFGDILVLGSLPYNYSQEAHVYLYLGSAEGVNPTPQRIYNSDVLSDSSVTMAAAGDVDGDGFDDVVIGVPFISGPIWHDAAFLFRGCPQGLEETPAWTSPPELDGIRLVSGAGDVNGDGYADVLLSGDYWIEGWENGDTGVFIFAGSENGLSNQPLQVISHELQDNVYFAEGFIPAGDVNGDGFDDIVVNGWRGSWSSTDSASEIIFLFLGSSMGLQLHPAWTASEWQESLYPMNSCTMAIGDLNGDGCKDLAFGVPLATREEGFNYGGGVFVFYGDGDGFGAERAWGFYSDWPNAYLGESLGLADFTGDGIDDLLVGGGQYNMSEESTEGVGFGNILLFKGTRGLLPEQPDYVLGNGSPNFFGRVMAGIGDVNGDGRKDLAVTSFNNENEGVTGKVLVYFDLIDRRNRASIGPLCFIESLAR